MGAEHWVWLQAVLGFGSRHLPDIVREFGGAERFYLERQSPKVRELGLSDTVLSRAAKCTLEDARSVVADSKRRGVDVLPYDSEEFPSQLRSIPDPPAVLYLEGQLPEDLFGRAVTVVGTRGFDEYGRQAAFSLCYRLGKAGCRLVSGVAEGIDATVYRAAKAVGSPEILVLPCGRAGSYLRSRFDMIEDVIDRGGCALSEMPPDEELHREAFRLRNRLLAGLSPVTAVVEAPEHSGALITASAAAEQGRAVYVMSGPKPNDPLFAGSHALLRDGASPLFKASDILQALSLMGGFTPDQRAAYAVSGKDLFDIYRAIFRVPVENSISRAKKKPAKRANPAGSSGGAARSDSDVKKQPSAGSGGGEHSDTPRGGGASAGSRYAAESASAPSDKSTSARSPENGAPARPSDKSISARPSVKPASETPSAKPAFSPAPAKSTSAPETAAPKVKLSDTAAAVYEALPVEGATADSVVVRTGLPGAKVLSSMTELEIKGLVVSAPGGRYIPVRDKI